MGGQGCGAPTFTAGGTHGGQSRTQTKGCPTPEIDSQRPDGQERLPGHLQIIPLWEGGGVCVCVCVCFSGCNPAPPPPCPI